MRYCLDTDALVTLGDVLDWDIAGGVRHVQTCDDCRGRIAALQAIHAVLMQADPIDEGTAARISAALSDEARTQRARARSGLRWMSTVELILAGIAAPIALLSGGVEIGNVTALLVTCALGPTLLLGGRLLGLYA